MEESYQNIPKAQYSRRIISASAVFLLWLSGSAYGFWYFSFKNLSPLADYWVSFEGANQHFSVSAGQVTLLHFVDPSCPCSRFSMPHVKDLQARYPAPQYRHLVVVAGQENAEHLSGLVAAVPASPAVMIFDDRGELAYFGPYSGGAICGQGEDLVSAIIDKLNKDYNPQWINQESVGCFCRWQPLS